MLNLPMQRHKDALSYARGETNTIEERRRSIMSVEEYNQMLINEGIAIGKTQGKEEGKAERDAEHVKNMALRGFTESDIAIALGMSEDEVTRLLSDLA